MKIGQVSAASGCQIETIRYYERIGLLKAPARTEAGYRHYTDADVDRLRFVARGRALGFSLEEIASLLRLAQDEGLSCDDVDRLARAHLADVQQRVGELLRIQEELQRTIEGCRGTQRSQCSILQALQMR
ncbi:MAG: helix-turn-helix domain-containing protein [Steroidobacteraceae bacterium]|nr:helix-turn-helix domain-containing protein [Steroidobacteraceae bacterium]